MEYSECTESTEKPKQIRKMKTIRAFLMLMLCVALTVSCEDKPKSGKWQDTPTSGLIPIAVDETFEPIIKTEIDVFETVYLHAGIMPTYTTETQALEMLFNDSVRLAIVSRTLTPAEKQAYLDKKREPRELHIATDAIALIVNKSNPDSIINVRTLKKILSGEIKKWSDLNPKTPLKGEISIVFDNTKSGNLRYIRDSLTKDGKLSENVYAQNNNSEVINYVEESPHAIGLIGVSWVGDNSDTTRMVFSKRVRVMAVSEFEFPSEENSYQPYQAYIALKKYPFTREVYAIINDPKGGLSTGFASF